jgi:hypothetical protein
MSAPTYHAARRHIPKDRSGNRGSLWNMLMTCIKHVKCTYFSRNTGVVFVTDFFEPVISSSISDTRCLLEQIWTYRWHWHTGAHSLGLGFAVPDAENMNQEQRRRAQSRTIRAARWQVKTRVTMCITYASVLAVVTMLRTNVCEIVVQIPAGARNFSRL